MSASDPPVRFWTFRNPPATPVTVPLSSPVTTQVVTVVGPRRVFDPDPPSILPVKTPSLSWNVSFPAPPVTVPVTDSAANLNVSFPAPPVNVSTAAKVRSPTAWAILPPLVPAEVQA